MIQKVVGGIDGGPQGSVLAPILSNVMYDDILRLRLPKGAQIVGSADDIALVIRGKYLDELVRTCYTAVSVVKSCIAEIGLKLADHKTDVLLVSSWKRVEVDQRITAKQAIKYLGVVISNRFTFREHLTYIGGKCATTSCALAQIMRNLGGPKQDRRRLLMYDTDNDIDCNICNSYIGWSYKQDDLQNRIRSGLRVISAFHTVSTDAAVVIAGMMPLKLLVDVKGRKRDTRRGIDLSKPV